MRLYENTPETEEDYGTTTINIQHHNAKQKRTRINQWVRSGVCSEAIGNTAYHASFPVNDSNHMSQNEAASNFIDGSNPYQTYISQGGPALERVLREEHHNGVEEWEVEEEAAVATAARPADGTATARGRGRPSGSTNRDKATIAAEKAYKAARVEGRIAKNLPPRGRLNAEQQALLDEWMEANFTPSTD